MDINSQIESTIDEIKTISYLTGWNGQEALLYFTVILMNAGKIDVINSISIAKERILTKRLK